MSAPAPDRDERLQRVAAARAAGRYLHEIAHEEGVCIERVRQLLREHDAARGIRRGPARGPGRIVYQRWCHTAVSTRLYNVLADNCGHDPDIVRDKGRAFWASRPGCGATLMRELDAIIGEW